MYFLLNQKVPKRQGRSNSIVLFSSMKKEPKKTLMSFFLDEKGPKNQGRSNSPARAAYRTTSHHKSAALSAVITLLLPRSIFRSNPLW